ncbi:hypothetical protein BBJ28_00018433 [Nothophytophthora sp. Chile5]|nr:hypothetical protein BBJ28_00018433 [Nothophytophthora sp. Chile5]
MALELAKNAEVRRSCLLATRSELVNDFFQRDDALARLGDLFSETFAVVDRDLKPPRPHEFTQNVLDLAMQKLVEHLSWSLLTESDATPRSVGVPALLDLCIAGVANGHLINSAPYKVLEDLMEGQTISTCEKLWDLLESRKEKLTKSVFIAKAPGHTTKASLCLLRMCNALLRRLSKTHNSVFCGKILVFLSFTFALSERSAVNHTGKANVTNVTLFEDEEAFDSAETTDAAKVSEVVPGLEIDSDPSADSGPIDYNLYRTFWDLQRFFRNHQTATQSADNWETFRLVNALSLYRSVALSLCRSVALDMIQFSELNVVLAAFEGNAFSPDDLERSRDLTASSGGVVQSADIAMDELEDNKAATEQGAQEHFFQPKYLTNSRLFRLQLRDPILRECMLTQFLILFNDLTKVKPPVGSTTPKSKLTDLNNRVVALLRQTPSDGEGFSEMVSSVLERERNWIKWKQEKCPPYEKYPPALEKEAPSSKPSKPLIKRVRRNLTSPLLEQILSESSKPSQILEKIKGKERATEVSLATYTDRFKEAWDPENGIEEEYWPDKDAMVCWRTMRASMKGSVTHLNLAVNGTGALVKGILGLATSESTTSKDAPTASGSTPRQETTPSPRATAVEERPAAIKNEPKEPAESVHAASNAKSSGVHSALKRERSDSFKRAQNGNEPPVKRERVGRIRIRDDDMELHETALIVACRNKRMRTIKFLLKRGSRTDLVDRTGYSALRWAVTHEHVAMVRLLLRYNASVTKLANGKNSLPKKRSRPHSKPHPLASSAVAMLSMANNTDAGPRVIRLPPYKYVHVLDTNSNVSRVLAGPLTYTRQEHEHVLTVPQDMIVLPAQHYVEVANPVVRTEDGEIARDAYSQAKLQHGEKEFRIFDKYPEPFPLYPGEEQISPIRELRVVPVDSALRIRATRKVGKYVAGDEWLFVGPATYYPRVEEEVVVLVQAIVIKKNQAIKFRAEKKCTDALGTARDAGEEWLVRTPGAYLPQIDEVHVETLQAHILTLQTALHLRALRTFTDVYGTPRRAGEEWLVTTDTAETHVQDVHEEIIGYVTVTTLTNRQYCVVVDPVVNGTQRRGTREMRKGEASFFLQPGEQLENGCVEDICVLADDEAVLLQAIEPFVELPEEGGNEPEDEDDGRVQKKH